eukprot:5125863-Pleurochrysis_carterae.AAC.1
MRCLVSSQAGQSLKVFHSQAGGHGKDLQVCRPPADVPAQARKRCCRAHHLKAWWECGREEE